MASRRAIPSVLLAAVAFFANTAGAADDAARRATVAARIGPSAVTVGELEDRLAPIPRFQLATFGATPQAVARKFLGDVIVKEVLLALAAADRHLEQDPAVKHEVDRTLANATLRKLREGLGIANAIPMQDVQSYYDANRSRFDTSERIQVWRILCAAKDEAQSVIAEAKTRATPQAWNELAREHSVDKVTSLRGGNLGFVGDDGASNEPGLRADPAVVSAVKQVKDGEIVATPVPEGSGFAVVWRRGTTPGQHQTVAQAATQIRDILWRQRADAAEKALIDARRAAKVKDEDDSLLGSFTVPVVDESLRPRKRPAAPRR